MTRDIDLILAMMDEGLIGGDDVQAVHSLGPDSVSQRLAASACEAFGTPLNSANAKKTENANWKRIHAAYSRLGAHALAANPDWRASMRQAEDEHGHGHEYKPLSRVKMLLRCLTMALFYGAPRTATGQGESSAQLRSWQLPRCRGHFELATGASTASAQGRALSPAAYICTRHARLGASTDSPTHRAQARKAA